MRAAATNPPMMIGALLLALRSDCCDAMADALGTPLVGGGAEEAVANGET